MPFFAELQMSSTESISIMRMDRFLSALPARGIVNQICPRREFGTYYKVTKHNNLAFKLSRDHVNFLEDEYLKHPLLTSARQSLYTKMDIISSTGRESGVSILDACIRAQMDHTSYLELTRSIDNRNLVKQSTYVVWGHPKKGIPFIKEIVIQPYVNGINFLDMHKRTRNYELSDRYAKYIPFLGPQLRMFLEHKDIVDFLPRNFIYNTKRNKLVYIDYQPKFMPPYDIEAEMTEHLVKSWGY